MCAQPETESWIQGPGSRTVYLGCWTPDPAELLRKASMRKAGYIPVNKVCYQIAIGTKVSGMNNAIVK